MSADGGRSHLKSERFQERIPASIFEKSKMSLIEYASESLDRRKVSKELRVRISCLIVAKKSDFALQPAVGRVLLRQQAEGQAKKGSHAADRSLEHCTLKTGELSL